MKDDELLSPDKLTGREHDDIFERAFTQVTPRRWRVPVFSALALAAGLTLFLVLDEGYREKGGDALEPTIEVACSPAPCRKGARVVIAFTALRQATMLTLVTRAADGRALSTLTQNVAPATPRSYLPVVLTLGDEYPPGVYTLTTTVEGHALATSFEVLP